jgi:hypothetical protein
MINSMFSLDHRLAELRPSEADQRVARQLRDAAAAAGRPARSITETVRPAATRSTTAMPLSRLAAG